MPSWGPRGGLSLPTSRGLAVTLGPAGLEKQARESWPPRSYRHGLHAHRRCSVCRAPCRGRAEHGAWRRGLWAERFSVQQRLPEPVSLLSKQPGNELRAGHDSQAGGTRTWLREGQAR